MATTKPKLPVAYAGLDKIGEEADKAQKKAIDSTYAAAALPYQLRDDFNKNKNPALDKAIVEKQSEVIGGAITGLEKFQDIFNPFQRRALAEKFQGGLHTELDSLTSERDRRQGKFEEYITKWTGLYGAEAAREVSYAGLAETKYNRAKSMADTIENNRRYEAEQAESTRRWNIEQANKGTEKADKYTDIEVRKMINEAKAAGRDWQTIADTLGSAGIDVSSGSMADNELRRLHGLQPVSTSSASRTPKQQMEDDLYSSIKNSRDEAAEGDLYKKNGRVYKKKSGFFGGNNDEEVEL